MNKTDPKMAIQSHQSFDLIEALEIMRSIKLDIVSKEHNLIHQ